MLYKSKIREDLKKTILKYSEWKYEKDQLKSKKDRKERKKFLNDFYDRVKNYDGTKVVKVPLISLTRVINERKKKGDTSPIWRQVIDYSLRD